MELQCFDNKARSVYTNAFVLWEEAVHEVHLPLLEALHSKGHSLQGGNHIFRVAEGQMAEEALVLFIDVVVYDCIRTSRFADHALLEACHDFL